MTLPLPTLSHIETQRLRLRPLRPNDAEMFRAITDDPVITEAAHFLPMPFTLADARRLIAGGDRDCFWGIWLREDGQDGLRPGRKRLELT